MDLATPCPVAVHAAAPADGAAIWRLGDATT
ncbi:uncharacterized protein SOCE836_079110 [Sorangium cellulosum]|uniref:Uncharacterized protein n=1 Tax=Sorangium cellulosum TaxID=56 RepID=A0A4P2R1B2_SORCE|nr:uncharacterized protein SOCE836_079110 [Sorangium cellulosum]WCQ95013.1 hypothetical protein NQZ70_07788 [Sorangium sp. Soce836]